MVLTWFDEWLAEGKLRQLFDERYKHHNDYGQMYCHSPIGGQYKWHADYVAKFCCRDAYILELGCGGGHLLWELSELGFRNIVGIDFSIVGLKQGLKVNRIYADLAALPFPDNCFDLVVSMGVLEHMPFENISLIIQESLRMAPCAIHWIDRGAADRTHLIQEGEEWWAKKFYQFVESSHLRFETDRGCHQSDLAPMLIGL